MAQINPTPIGARPSFKFLEQTCCLKRVVLRMLLQWLFTFYYLQSGLLSQLVVSCCPKHQVFRELELTLLSARELKNVNLITRMDVYAVVTISGDPLTRQCTAADPSGGRNPRWDATLRFAVPPTAAAAAGSCLHVLLRAERVLGDRDVGEVVIPLAELLAGAPAAGPQQPQAASYQVRKVHRREPRGVLNVAYRLGPVVAPVGVPEKKPPAAPVMGVAYPYPPVGVPPPQPFQQPPPDTYPPPQQPFQQPPPDTYRPPPRPAAKNKHDPAPPPRNNGKSNGRLGMEGPTQVCVGPHTQIILGGGGGPATTTMSSSPTGSNVSSPRKAAYGAWPKQELHHDHHDDTTTTYASAAQSIFSPRKEEDHSRSKVPAASTWEAAATASPRGPSPRPPLSAFSSHGSSSSPPPYSPARPFTPSPSSSAATTPSPRPLGQSAAGDAFGSSRATSHTNSTNRAAISSPLPSSPRVANHTSMVPSR